MSLTSFFDLCVASLIPFNPWWRATTCAFSVQVLPKLWRIITIREQTKYHHILWLHSKHMMWKPRPFSAKKIKKNDNKNITSNPMQNFDLRRRSLHIKLFPMNILSSLKWLYHLTDVSVTSLTTSKSHMGLSTLLIKEQTNLCRYESSEDFWETLCDCAAK